MNNILTVTRYQLRDFRKAVLIYYSIILGLGLLLITTIRSDGQANFGGASLIFIFVLGLNSFKNSFKFTQANNVPRKMFYLGNIIAIGSISGIMSVIDLTLDRIFFTSSVNYAGIFEQVYRMYGGNQLLANFFWTFSLLMLATSLGNIITMIYYRSNSIMKIVVSLSPVIFVVIFGYLTKLTKGSIVRVLGQFAIRALGLAGSGDPYAAVLSFTVVSVGILSLSYLLIFRAPIKG